MGSLIELFEEYDLTVAILTETWFKSGGNLDRELEDLEAGENISVINKNRSGREEELL